MCRHMMTRTALDGRPPHSMQHPKASAASLYGNSCGDAESSISSSSDYAYVSSSLNLAGAPEVFSPLRGPQPPEAAGPFSHESVSRSLFQGDAGKAFVALPRLIVPAQPFSKCYGGSPMQLPTPAAAEAVQPGIQKPSARAGSVREWLETMEQELGSSSSRSRLECTDPLVCTSGATAAAGPSTARTDLPQPAFVLMGVLQ